MPFMAVNPLSFVIDNLLATAFSLYQQGKLPEAAQRCRSVLQMDARSVDALNLLGLILSETGQEASAEACFREALRHQPETVEIWLNLGMLLKASGRFTEALEAYDRALRGWPDMAAAHFNRGNLLRELGRPQEAVEAFVQAVRCDPQDPDAYNNCATLLQKARRHEEAVAWFDRALRIAPDNLDLHVGKAASLEQLGRREEAGAIFERVLAFRPEHVEATVGRGLVLEAAAQTEAALECFTRAAQRDPAHYAAHWNAALCLLKLGRYREGWPLYEWRLREPREVALRQLAEPRWQGEPLAGRTLLVHAEQGLGDTLQFCRFLPQLARQGTNIVFELQAALLPLLEGRPGMGRVVAQGEALPEFDLHCELISLPLLLDVTLDTLPVSGPYLDVRQARLDVWARRLGPATAPRIALVWRTTTPGDRIKSLSVDQLAPLLATGMEFHVAQKVVSDEERRYLAAFPNVSLHDDALGDFEDTAALLSQMDRVISIDTSVAHLAGGLGREVWILLPFAADWRWLEGRYDSPWYPSARLFRQTSPGDWQGVVAALTSVLNEQG